MDFTKNEVAKQLALQGYRIPDADLAEVTHRLNALITRLREVERLRVYEVEPWPVQPPARTDV